MPGRPATKWRDSCTMCRTAIGASTEGHRELPVQAISRTPAAISSRRVRRGGIVSDGKRGARPRAAGRPSGERMGNIAGVPRGNGWTAVDRKVLLRTGAFVHLRPPASRRRSFATRRQTRVSSSAPTAARAPMGRCGPGQPNVHLDSKASGRRNGVKPTCPTTLKVLAAAAGPGTTSSTGLAGRRRLGLALDGRSPLRRHRGGSRRRARQRRRRPGARPGIRRRWTAQSAGPQTARLSHVSVRVTGVTALPSACIR